MVRSVVVAHAVESSSRWFTFIVIAILILSAFSMDEKGCFRRQISFLCGCLSNFPGASNSTKKTVPTYSFSHSYTIYLSYLRNQSMNHDVSSTLHRNFRQRCRTSYYDTNQAYAGICKPNSTTPNKSESFSKFSCGSRKRAYAKVEIFRGSGNLLVNDRDGGEYFRNNPWWIHNCYAPLKQINLQYNFNIKARVRGGGLGGQSGAIMLAVAREIIKKLPRTKRVLRESGFLTADSRVIERKKFGRKKARKSKQYSKR